MSYNTPSFYSPHVAGDLEIKREAAWAISNATSGGDYRQIQQLVQYGCIPPLTELLRVMDPRIMQVCHFPVHTRHALQCQFPSALQIATDCDVGLQ
jgi:hypothetical protein